MNGFSEGWRSRLAALMLLVGLVSVSSHPAVAATFSNIVVDNVPTNSTTNDEASVDRTRLVVTLETEATAAMRRTLAREVSGKASTVVDADTFVIKLRNGDSADELAELRDIDGVDSVAYDPIMRAAATPNDPCVSGCSLTDSSTGQAVTLDQWGYGKVGASQAWDQSRGDGVTVAVLDTGVDLTHVQLVGKVTVGPAFTDAPTAADTVGHGSHVAGIVGAQTNDGMTVAGLGWNTQVLSLQVLNGAGIGSSSQISTAIRYAADQGVRVINMSLSGSGDGGLCSAIEYAHARNVVVVAAAGNEATSTPQYPAACPYTIGVAATTRSDTLASFSNRGASWVDLAAPGVGILSTWKNNSYAVESGTSMASPMVAAAAALVISEYPTLPADSIVSRLLRSATPFNAGVAAGRLNVAGAMSSALDGYWMASTDGGVFNFGDNNFYGSAGGGRLNQPIVGMAAKPDQGGYWLVASDGGIFSYGNTSFYGSTGAIKLNQPIVGMASTPTGRGYWLVASDGGIFAFGDASFYGSTGALRLNQPIVGMTSTANGGGYWFVGSDGGIFAFGNAAFYGSAGGSPLNRPIVAISRSRTGAGYRMVASDGGIFTYGDASFLGSASGSSLGSPIVSFG